MKTSPFLKAGDLVGIAAPSSAFDKQTFLAGVQLLETWGLVPVFRHDILARQRYFAGTQQRRRQELQALINNQEIKAILFARGGFGSHFLLPGLKLDRLGKYPKRVMGYSDLSLLLNQVPQKQKLITYYGPTVCDLGRIQSSVFRQRVKKYLMGSSPDGVWDLKKCHVIQPGRVEGHLAGGCLTLLNMSVGTSFEIKTRNCILLIEDVNEPVYAVERFLLHLKQAGKLQGVKGIVIAELQDLQHQATRRDWVNMLQEFFHDFTGPVVYGLRFGHVKNPYILPLGAAACLDTHRGELMLV